MLPYFIKIQDQLVNIKSDFHILHIVRKRDGNKDGRFNSEIKDAIVLEFIHNDSNPPTSKVFLYNRVEDRDKDYNMIIDELLSLNEKE